MSLVIDRNNSLALDLLLSLSEKRGVKKEVEERLHFIAERVNLYISGYLSSELYETEMEDSIFFLVNMLTPRRVPTYTCDNFSSYYPPMPLFGPSVRFDAAPVVTPSAPPLSALSPSIEPSVPALEDLPPSYEQTSGGMAPVSDEIENLPPPPSYKQSSVDMGSVAGEVEDLPPDYPPPAYN